MRTTRRCWRSRDGSSFPSAICMPASPGSEPTYFVQGQRYPRQRADEDFKPVREALARDLRGVGVLPTFDNSTPAAVRLDRIIVRESPDPAE